MNCSVCGAGFADGQPACPNCGTPVQQPQMGQPVQPMMGQPMQPQMGQPMQPQMGYQQPMGQPMQPQMGYQQPMGQPMQPQMAYQQPMMGGGMNGFFNSLKADYMKLIAVIGALLIMISPFFNWMSMKFKYDGDSEKEAYNMFKVASEGDVGSYTLFAILLIAIGALLVVWDLADFVPALHNFKMKLVTIPYVELILVAVALVVVLLAFFNGDVKDAIDLGKDTLDMLKDWYGSDVSGHCNHGLGPIIAFVGIAGAAYPRVIKMIKK